MRGRTRGEGTAWVVRSKSRGSVDRDRRETGQTVVKLREDRKSRAGSILRKKNISERRPISSKPKEKGPLWREETERQGRGGSPGLN